MLQFNNGYVQHIEIYYDIIPISASCDKRETHMGFTKSDIKDPNFTNQWWATELDYGSNQRRWVERPGLEFQ